MKQKFIIKINANKKINIMCFDSLDYEYGLY